MPRTKQTKPGPEVGKVFVKEFYIVGIVPHAMPGGFFVCGSHGVPTSTSGIDGMCPTLGTDYKMALGWYELAKEKYAEFREQGTLVLIKFTGGVIEKLDEFNPANEIKELRA